MVRLAAHDLGRPWPPGRGGEWLEQVLDQLSVMDGADAVSLGGYLDRHPTGVLGRPGPSRRFSLRAPHGSDLFDRCRAAADLLTFALEHRRGFSALDRRCVAHMTRSLLRAQQVDWSLPPGHGIDADTGLQRAWPTSTASTSSPACSWRAAPTAAFSNDLDRGPAYLPEIDLELLTG